MAARRFTLTLLLLATATTQAVAQTSAPGSCFRGRPKEQCLGYWITDFSVMARLTTFTERHDPYRSYSSAASRLYMSGDLGYMVNFDSHNAVGASLYLAVHSGVSGGALLRYHHWLNSVSSLQFGFGPIFDGETESFRYDFPSFIAEAGWSYADVFALTSRVEFIRYNTEQSVVSWLIGGKLGSWGGAPSVIVGLVAMGVALGSCC